MPTIGQPNGVRAVKSNIHPQPTPPHTPMRNAPSPNLNLNPSPNSASKPFQSFFRYAAALALAAGLAACGGGGGGTTPTTPVDSCSAANVALTYPAFNATVGTPVNVTPSGVPAACTGANYTVVAALPAGLSLNPNTGVITGTPTAVGSSSFSVRITLPVSNAVLSSNTVNTSVFAAGSSITINGTALNTIYLNNTTNGRLIYSAPVLKPMRGLLVEAVQNGTVLTTGTTTDTGTYALSLPANTGSVYLRIKASLQRSAQASWNVQVKDNTNGNALYSLVSSNFTVGTTNVTQDVTAASGWSTSGTVIGTRASAPFAILDTVYSAMKKVTTVAPNTAFAALNIYWSVNNTTASGSVSLGQIGTSYFDGNSSVYILGKEGVDTDEFDDSVIAHEWGHYAQANLWRDDSIGGRHGLGDKLDMRVSFSEGWGNAWSGIATDKNIYSDSNWNGASPSGFNLYLSTSPSAGNRGWFSEDSVYYTIYSLYNQVGLAPIWQSLLAMKDDDALSTIYSLQANLPPGRASNAMATLMASQGNTGTGKYAVGETNLATFPPYRSLSLGVPATGVCVGAPYGAGNKAGNFAALKFTNPTAGSRTVTVTGASTTDPDFEIYQKGVRLYLAETSIAGYEAKAINVSSGDFVILVNDYPLTTSACFNVTVQ
jgi:Putative Ig domain